MNSADDGHWAFGRVWTAWQMQETNSKINRSLKCHGKKNKHAIVQQWLEDKEILEVHLHDLE